LLARTFQLLLEFRRKRTLGLDDLVFDAPEFRHVFFNFLSFR